MPLRFFAADNIESNSNFCETRLNDRTITGYILWNLSSVLAALQSCELTSRNAVYYSEIEVVIEWACGTDGRSMKFGPLESIFIIAN